MDTQKIIDSARKEVEYIKRRYFSRSYLEKFYPEKTDQFENLFEFHNSKSGLWKGLMDLDQFNEWTSFENILKTFTLRANVEKVGYADYKRYHWIIETTPTYEFWPEYRETGIEIRGYLEYIIKHNGDVESAFKDMMGDAEMFIDYANDIASTAF